MSEAGFRPRQRDLTLLRACLVCGPRAATRSFPRYASVRCGSREEGWRLSSTSQHRRQVVY
jgi:hypothetical protein